MSSEEVRPMKPPFYPTPTLSRLEAVTTTASTTINRLEAEVSWYRAAMIQKGTWARELELKNLRLESRLSLCYAGLIFLTLALLACATALALRWL